MPTLSSGFAVICFQAEDGIRDLVRSRGLGDVYKRQPRHFKAAGKSYRFVNVDAEVTVTGQTARVMSMGAVSYTHLTLPTSDLV